MQIVRSCKEIHEFCSKRHTVQTQFHCQEMQGGDNDNAVISKSFTAFKKIDDVKENTY